MRFRFSRPVLICAVVLACAVWFSVASSTRWILHAAAGVSVQEADVFDGKLNQIARGAPPTGVRRTAVSEGELNSWFAYRAQPLLPAGVSSPKLTILGDGKVAGQVTVDLDAVAKPRASGGLLDPWSYLTGRVPVGVSGSLRTADGVGRFDLEAADISGVPVPKALLQDLLTRYSRSATHPQGIRLDEGFELPVHIRQIEVGQGQAVVVQ